MKPGKLTVNGCGRKSPACPASYCPREKSIRSAEALRMHIMGWIMGLEPTIFRATI